MILPLNCQIKPVYRVFKACATSVLRSEIKCWRPYSFFIIPMYSVFLHHSSPKFVSPINFGITKKKQCLNLIIKHCHLQLLIPHSHTLINFHTSPLTLLPLFLFMVSLRVLEHNRFIRTRVLHQQTGLSNNLPLFLLILWYAFVFYDNRIHLFVFFNWFYGLWLSLDLLNYG